MNGLVELTFENVPDKSVNKLVSALLNGTPPSEIAHSELGNRDVSDLGGDFFRLFAGADVPASMFIKTERLSVGGIEIHRPVIRILRLENFNEVTVVFDNSDVLAGDRKEALSLLATCAEALATESGVVEFYCGFEPSTDEATRLFTGKKIGPLKII